MFHQIAFSIHCCENPSKPSLKPSPFFNLKWQEHPLSRVNAFKPPIKNHSFFLGDFFNDSDIRTIRCGEYVCDDKILYIFEAVQTNKFTLSLVSAKLYFVVFNIDNFRSILHQVRCWSFVPDFEIIKFLHPLHQAEIS